MNTVGGRPFAGYPALPPGSLIGVIAPAGSVEPERLAEVPALYAGFGYRCRVYPGCALRSDYLAGPDAVRLADLHAALADDEVAALHAIRGGYGCMRIVDGVDTALLRAHPKLLVGYSDLTALHALWAREGLPTLHAPMAASDMLDPGRLASHDSDRDALFTLLQRGLRAGDVLAPALEASPLRVGGRTTGRLIGGNLSLVAALLGTPWAWSARGALLFLEDVSEDLYRVDRLLTQLRLAGVFDAVAGIVLGSFTEAEAPAALLHDMLLPLCRAQRKPLLAGWPAGHGTPNRPLPLGLLAELDADAGTLTLRQTLLQAPARTPVQAAK
ncbi:MAG: LD-carboxypeptidase [Leptothrix sp. (in: Bacteria)]|nr:LD-carboxypeptidase [Leptothrix sp. (in: b-proteobacteria)]